MLTKITFTAVVLLFGTTAFSQNHPQQSDIFKSKEFNLPSFDQPIILKNDSTLKHNQKLREEIIRRRIGSIRGRYSHSILNGKVFVLPPDNMPCLVPDKERSVAMPNWVAPQKPESMPNGITPHKVIRDKNE